eukprot:6433602-Ditylum_brightwellii.AAC.1
MRAENPGKKSMLIADVAAVVGEAWRTLPDDLQVKYTALTEEDKQRYSRELKEYHNSNNSINSINNADGAAGGAGAA